MYSEKCGMIKRINDLVKRKEISCKELTSRYIEEID